MIPVNQVAIPHWMAKIIREKHGSLEAYSQKVGVRVTDAYWDELAQETQAMINARLIRGWKRA